jgi:ribosomal protein S18 acetylase RimI-like enzyme
VRPSPAPSLTLRPVEDGDREFLLRLYGTTRADLTQVAWPPGQLDALLRMQFDAQDADYRRSNPHASFEVVEMHGEPVGRLYVDRRDDEIRLVDISLLPEVRGAGLGSLVIGGLQDEAIATGRRLTLHVEVHNPVVSLYTRLGFRQVSEQGPYRLLEWGSQ